MRELSRRRPEGQIEFTRTQLSALGATGVSALVMTFFLGVMAGRHLAPDAPEPTQVQASLIPAEVMDEDLPQLLARVEAAAYAAQPSNLLTFPEQLPADEPAPLIPAGAEPPLQEEVVVVEPGLEAPAEPPPAGDERPDDGWAVEVGYYGELAEAQARVEELRQSGHQAFRVESLEQGMTRFRVRIGAYTSKAEAAQALGELREALHQDDLRVTEVR